MLSKQFEFEMISREIGHPRNRRLSKGEIALFIFAGAAIAFAIFGIVITSGKV